jgi:hypothetical protein
MHTISSHMLSIFCSFLQIPRLAYFLKYKYVGYFYSDGIVQYDESSTPQIDIFRIISKEILYSSSRSKAVLHFRIIGQSLFIIIRPGRIRPVSSRELSSVNDFFRGCLCWMRRVKTHICAHRLRRLRVFDTYH